MKISTKGRYGLRILLDLAMNDGAEPRMIRSIAESQDISPKYISRLVIALRRAGLVTSIRGARGGYRLARRPRDISLLEVVEVMEGPINLVDCVCDPEACERISICPASPVWQRLNRQIRHLMSELTLQNLLDGQDPPGLGRA